MSGDYLLPAELMPLLERMSLQMNRRVAGARQGKRRSKQVGTSLDFADYRMYVPGDDLRQLDWNAYGRTGKPFVKLYLDEQEWQVNLWVDTSESMSFSPNGSTSKLNMAKRLAAAIGYISLCNYDRVELTTFGERPAKMLPPMRGKGSYHRLQHALLNLPTSPNGDLLAAVKVAASKPSRPGLSWVFSDFMFESGVKEAISLLEANGQSAVLVHILSPDELSPDLSGDLRLVDVEQQTGRDVAISGNVLRVYQQKLKEFIEEVRRYGFQHGLGYVLVPSDASLQTVLTEDFRKIGLIR